MKKLLLGIVLLAAVLNGAYIMKAYNKVQNGKDLIVGMMEMGMGTEVTHTYSSSIYGKDFVVSYSLNDNNKLIQEFNWK